MAASPLISGSLAAHELLDEYILPFCFINLERSVKDLVARTVPKI